MNEYVAIVRRTSNEDELQHFKYIKREKKNGKWVYTYTKDGDGNAKVKDMARDAVNETSRAADRVKYTIKEEKFAEEHANAKTVKEKVSSGVKRGSNLALMYMNNIGDGTLDNSVNRGVEKAKSWLRKFFG